MPHICSQTEKLRSTVYSQLKLKVFGPLQVASASYPPYTEPWTHAFIANLPLQQQGISASKCSLPCTESPLPSLQVQNLATVNKEENNHCSPIS